MSHSIPAKKPRRRLMLSLRAMMVLVLVVGGGIGWFAHRVERQQRAVAAVQRIAGHVLYDFEWHDDELTLDGKSWAPDWLIKRIGRDAIHNVTVLEFQRAPSDVDLMVVEHLPALEHLNIWGTGVTDAVMPRSASLGRLKHFDFRDTAITDAGLVHFHRMPQLTSLGFDSDTITDGGLAHLEGLASLRMLAIRGDNVTGAGLGAREVASEAGRAEDRGSSLGRSGLFGPSAR